MALHWAVDFDIQASRQQLLDAGWSISQTAAQPYNADAGILPRHPIVGYGGMLYALRTNNTWYTPNPPLGALADGGFQVHFWPGNLNTNASWFALTDATRATLLLELRNYSTNGAYAVYSHNTLRGYTSSAAYVNLQSWNVLAVRFKDDTVNGEIQVSINNVPVFSYSGNTGGTSAWGPFRGNAFYDASYWCGLSWWDSAADDFLTRTYWCASMPPDADATDGSYTDSDGGTSLFDHINLPLYTTTKYITTTTDPDEFRIGVSSSYVDAAWNPDAIAGLIITPGGRGDGTLNQATVTAYDGGTVASVDGTTATVSTSTSTLGADVLPLDPNGVAWTLAKIDSDEFGIKAT